MSQTGRRLEHANRILPQLAFNPLRTDETCAVCLGPRDWSSSPLCNSCRDLVDAAKGEGLADLVVPLSYAGEMNEQLRRDIRNYKDGPSLDVRADALYRLSALTWHFFHTHAHCLSARGGAPTHIASVPSGTPGNRSGRHPVSDLLRFAPEEWERVTLVRDAPSTARRLDAETLSISSSSSLEGRHVVIFDDTWTTGAKAQSAALRVRRAGARMVTIVVTARIMNTSWGPAARFLEDHPKVPWSGAVCPVTGGSCP